MNKSDLNKILGELVEKCIKCEGGDCLNCGQKSLNIEQTGQQIQELLPAEMANTKITPAFDTYYHGYNSAVKEMREVFGIESEVMDE